MTYSMTTEHPRINDFLSFWSLYYQYIEGILTESRAIQQKYPDFQSMVRLPLRTRAGRPLGFDLDLSNMEALTLLQHVNGEQDKSRLSYHRVNLVDIPRSHPVLLPHIFWKISLANSICRGDPETSSCIDSKMPFSVPALR